MKQAEKLDEVLLRQLSFVARGNIVGLTGFLGGVLAQEALKGLTGKYTPLQQFVRQSCRFVSVANMGALFFFPQMFFDAVEILPSVEDGKYNPAHFAPRNDRSDAHRIVLGQDTCAKLESMRLFMVYKPLFTLGICADMPHARRSELVRSAVRC